MADMVDNAAATTNETVEPQAPDNSGVDAINAGLRGTGEDEPKEVMQDDMTQPQTTERQKKAEEQGIPIPDKYDFHLPDGLTLTPEIENRFTELARGLGLTQEQADSLIKLHSDIMLDGMKQAETTKNEWAKACQKEGLTTAENMRGVKMVFDAFDPSGDVKKAMIESGIIYEPSVMRMLVTMGQILMEDSAPDDKPATVAKSGADILFQNSKY